MSALLFGIRTGLIAPLTVLALGLGCVSCTSENAAPAQAALPARPIGEGKTGSGGCSPGAMPSLIDGPCAPVGPQACADGFAPAKNGWGCAAIVPEAQCTGHTRAVLGTHTCVPVDDCTRAFPPAGATLVRDDASLRAALKAAKDGGAIALDAGTYGGFDMPRGLKELHVVGRCADDVLLRGTSYNGIYAEGAQKLSVESLSIQGFAGGIVAGPGAEVTASRVVVRDAPVAFGVGGKGARLLVTASVAEQTRPLMDRVGTIALSTGSGGTLEVTDSEVRGLPFFTRAQGPGTKLVVRRSSFSDLGGAGGAERVLALAGSESLFEESVLRFNSGSFAYVAPIGRDMTPPKGSGGSLSLVRTTVEQSGAEIEEPLSQVEDGGHVVLEAVTIEHRSRMAWTIRGPGSTATLKNSVIVNPIESNVLRGALYADSGAVAELDGTAIIGAQQQALLAARGGTHLTVKRSFVQDTHVGFSVVDPKVGAMGVALAVLAEATASVEGSAFVNSVNESIVGAGSAQIDVRRSIVDGTSRSPEGRGGFAVSAFLGTHVAIEDSVVARSSWAALLVADRGTKGVVKRTRFIDNPLGVYTSGIDVVDTTNDSASPSPGQLLLFETVFEGTNTRVFEGTVVNPFLDSFEN